MPVINRIAAYQDDLTAWRQHLHAHPELDFDTHQTAAFVVEKLESFGVDEIVTGIGRTGVVGVINGRQDGPTIGLRADMDALPITELRDLPYKSRNAGVMHACGHDGHTTMLLGAARYLAETRNFCGRVALIFQPAEEGSGGGRAMCEDGMMDRFSIDQVYAIHNWPDMPEGRIEAQAGPVMAAADSFDIHITGHGAHAARPNISVDPVMVAVHMVQALQSIVARQTDPMDPVVLSVTQIHAGTASNIIPETAFVNGTVRTMRKGHNQEVREQMERIVSNTAAAFGAEARLDFHFGYPPTINHAAETQTALAAARDVVGDALVSSLSVPAMGAEDFSYMLEERPGAYLFLGQGKSAGLHHPEYDFNDAISPIGASFFARLVETSQPTGQ